MYILCTDTGTMCEIKKEILSQLCGELPSVENVIALRYVARLLFLCTSSYIATI